MASPQAVSEVGSKHGQEKDPNQMNNGKTKRRKALEDVTMHRVEVMYTGAERDDIEGVWLDIFGFSTIYLAFGKLADLEVEARKPFVCEIFLPAHLKLTGVNTFCRCRLMGMTPLASIETEVVSFSNVPEAISEVDSLVRVKETWYKFDLSDDDKIICFHDTSGRVQPAICLPSCDVAESHSYFILLGEKRKISEVPVRKARYVW
ncbi:hypothetical protein H2200_013014 [Cladophialophora chaetospira]|uniref:Uncharacterized protein n=1 Tax=Cladophialophora chaetospira TaxID=386627 RepID=A0AA38WWK3_9EURO|nr:hypothetical protein H2200_013014 [Cladophialophora chaetospira]